jgi:oxysterol-binding protein-related protein 8
MAASETGLEDDPRFFDTVESLPGFENALTNAAPRPRPVRLLCKQGSLAIAQVGHNGPVTSNSHPFQGCDAPKNGFSRGDPYQNSVASSNSEYEQQALLEHDGCSCCNLTRQDNSSWVEHRCASDRQPNRLPFHRDRNQVQEGSLGRLREQGSEAVHSALQLEHIQGRYEKAPTLGTSSAMHDRSIGDERKDPPARGTLQVKTVEFSNVKPSGSDDPEGVLATALSSTSTEAAADAEKELGAIARPACIPRKYSVVHDALYADRAPETEISIVKIATEVISSVKQGADVTNVNLPASVLDPVSSLEKCMKSMQRGGLIPSICTSPAPLDRFLGVLRFYFSGLSKERFGKKPYNPILGEVFRSCFVHENEGGCTVLVAEQVSHHPPITALHLCNETLGFKMNSFTAPEPRFWGNSVEVKLRGVNRITLEKWDNEEYELTRPYIHMSGFLAGRHRLEFIGTTSVACAKTDLSAEIEFKSKGILGRGDLNGIHGRVYTSSTGVTMYTMSGTWDGILTAKNTITSEEHVLFDYDLAVAQHSMIAILPPHEEREETFSSSVWKDCSEAIWKADSVAANVAKRRIEDRQRELRKERSAQGIAWSHVYFEPRKDGREGLRSMLGPDVELLPEDRVNMEESRRAVAIRAKEHRSDKGAMSSGHKGDIGARRMGRHKNL